MTIEVDVIRYYLYCYLIIDSITNEVIGCKIGITTQHIILRIKNECIRNIKSTLGYTFAAGDILFFICLDEEDPLYNKICKSTRRDAEFYKTRVLYYERVILTYLREREFQRTDMYIERCDGTRYRKTEFFNMKNHRGECVKDAIDKILSILNIDVNAEQWYLCVGCDDVAGDSRGQICDHCEISWCHKKCANSYKLRFANILYNYNDGQYTCHNCS